MPAASPSKLSPMTLNNAKGIILAKHLVVTDTLDREHLDVEMHQKMTVRTAVITDTSTGNEDEIEGKRILFHHMNDMLDAPQDPRARQRRARDLRRRRVSAPCGDLGDRSAEPRHVRRHGTDDSISQHSAPVPVRIEQI